MKIVCLALAIAIMAQDTSAIFTLKMPGKDTKFVGCYNDNILNRAIYGEMTTYKPEEAVQKCYERAKSIGATIFGVQFNHQCFTNKVAEKTFAKYGQPPLGFGCLFGRGGVQLNDIYRISYHAQYKWKKSKGFCVNCAGRSDGVGIADVFAPNAVTCLGICEKNPKATACQFHSGKWCTVFTAKEVARGDGNKISECWAIDTCKKVVPAKGKSVTQPPPRTIKHIDPPAPPMPPTRRPTILPTRRPTRGVRTRGPSKAKKCTVTTFSKDGYKGRKYVYRKNTGMVRENDKVRSVKITPGCCVTLFVGGGFKGKTRKVCKNVGSLGKWWGRRISALKITGAPRPRPTERRPTRRPTRQPTTGAPPNAKCVSLANRIQTKGCYDTRVPFKRGKLLIYWRHEIDWKNISLFASKLACACSSAAKRAGAKYFGLHFYGECWALERSEIKRANNGDCTLADGKYNHKCTGRWNMPWKQECLGNKSYFVYKILARGEKPEPGIMA